jgi:hypothetical protein
MTYDFTAALVRGLGGHVRQVRIDHLHATGTVGQAEMGGR